MLVLVLLFAIAGATDMIAFQPDWEKGLAHLPEVVEQRMLRIQSQLFDLIHKRKLDDLHRIFLLIEDALAPIHLPPLKKSLEEHLAQLHEHYVEQSKGPVAKISHDDISKLKNTFHS
jgi:hypothetical protein